ncbi:hypothetical protein G5V57_02840 [Nordella sp. HKS 07]|uniref:hypothetical protein n=1 Tax=Nordella sp. HKS 07 TaxID=2712222 RepID=UPI0013E1D26C|nr:hypothetical protein [Nordella sp. HKS 07]QIG46780.1 hypothetical protein G5V57_02840 [Nordella sp. HKS 07]
MSSDPHDWHVFTFGELTMGERVEQIVEVLERGNPSPEFCRELADCLRGVPERGIFVLKPVPARGAGRPRNNQQYGIGMEMGRLVDDQGISVKEAIHQVQRRFGKTGTTRSQCLAALKAERETRKSIENMRKLCRQPKRCESE